MRHFNSIIEQPTPPATNAIWLHGSTAKYFTNGKWITIGEAGDVSWNDIIDKPAEFYTLPTATTTTLGGVKRASGVAALVADAELATVISTINDLLSKLKTAGIMVNN